MSISVRDVLSEDSARYKLKLLGGGRGDQKSISWVHVIEDSTIIQNFWGNELAVTLGIGFPSAGALLRIIDLLIKKRCSGLIINTGKYIQEVPKEVVDYCDEHDFPLITVPWEVYVSEMVKDFCMRIFEEEQNEKRYARAFLQAIRTPDNLEVPRKTLKSAYHLEGKFKVIILYLNEALTDDLMTLRKMESRVRAMLERHGYSYCLFNEEGYYILILNDANRTQSDQILEFIATQNTGAEAVNVNIGEGTTITGIEDIHKSFRRARAATRMAIIHKRRSVSYRDMGVNSILYNVEDEEILREYHDNILEPLLSYDKKHQANYVETLRLYLEFNGSLQAVAQEMFTHKNTVNYRMNKIYELLGTELEKASERFPYEMAFYIKDALGN